jgi:predicted dehydrogenase
MTYTVAVIGTGADPDDPDTDGFAMAYRHAGAYRRLDSCELTACADVVPENAKNFGEQWDLPDGNVYTDTEKMLTAVEPDIVSVCVPPHIHAPVVMTCAESGVMDAIHCEKPMATRWEDCQKMASACKRAGIQLTFNHQRRFGKPFRKAKSLLENGKIGSLERIELGGKNLFDYGSHLFDLCGYFTDQAMSKWVMAGIEYSEENVQFGAHNENQAIAQWRYTNGVNGLASTGDGGIVDCHMRLLGSDGLIEIGGEVPLRVRTGKKWTTVDTDGEDVHGPRETIFDAAKQKISARIPGATVENARPETYIDRAIADTADALDTGREPELSADNALQATELIFGCWESARRCGRVDFPLEIDDNPLKAMVESGQVLTADNR